MVFESGNKLRSNHRKKRKLSCRKGLHRCEDAQNDDNSQNLQETTTNDITIESQSSSTQIPSSLSTNPDLTEILDDDNDQIIEETPELENQQIPHQVPNQTPIGVQVVEIEGELLNEVQHGEEVDMEAEIVPEIDNLRKRKTFPEQEKMRVAVEMYYRANYFDAYNEEYLDGKGGIVAKICSAFPNFVSNTTVKEVILSVNEACNHGIRYDAKRKKYEREVDQKIKKDSFELHLIKKFKSNGASYKTCTEAINAKCRATQNKSPLSVTSVYNAIKKSKHILRRTKRRSQCKDKNLLYRQARFNWFAQLLARMGVDLGMDESDEEGTSWFRKHLKDVQ